MNGGERRWITWLATAIPLMSLAASLLVRVAFWFRRAYNHDDFYFAYFSWIRSTAASPGHDFYVPNFTPLVELSAPLFRLTSDSFAPLDIARGVILLVSFVLLALTWRIASRLSGSTTWALALTAVVSWQSSFMQRIGDVRGDPFGATLLLLAILLILEGRKLIGAALCVGFAVVFSIKLVYALPFVIAAIGVAARERRLRTMVAATASAAAPPFAYLLWRIRADTPAVVLAVFRDIQTAAGVPEHPYENAVLALKSDPWFWILICAGAAISLYRGVGGKRGEEFWYASIVLTFLVVFFLRNPFLFPYNFVILVPLAVPLMLGLRIRRFDAVVVILLSLFAVANGARGTLRMLNQNNAEQRRLIEWIWRATSPQEGVFDWQGMHFYRRGVVHWFIYGAQRYVGGDWYSLADEWPRANVTLMIPNYRFDWINARDRDYLARHYVAAAPCVLIPGFVFRQAGGGGGNFTFDVAIEGDYDLQPHGVKAIIDGRPAGPRVHFHRGLHSIEVKGPAALLFTTRRREVAGPPPCPAGPLLFGF